MNKRLNMMMLVVIMAQYLVPTSFAASEISSYLVESSSEVTSETQSQSRNDNTSKNSINEDTSDEASDISDITREESEIDSESVSEIEAEKPSEINSQNTSEIISEQAEDSEAPLTEKQIAEIAASVKPEVRETVLPSVDFNVLNMDAPAGYYVPSESTLNGYKNGHNKVSAPNGRTKNVSGQGYVESYSNDPGVLQPDGTIDRNTCGKNNDLDRFDCEGILFPVDTNLGGGQGSNYLGNEGSVRNSDEIVIYYPEALDINGRLFDVKSTFTNFVKTSDSQGGDQGGWYTTFAVSHYFYDGYWLVDFQSVQQELQISDSVTGEPLNLADMKVYDFRFGMQSLNASGDEVTGEYTAEALQPYFGIDESTAVPTCDIENKYNYTLDAFAWEGTSAKECNGVSFNTTDTDTIEFRVAKNPSQADMWGNKYWEIAWFVPIFWATRLPANYTDAGDAKSSYGNGEIEIDGDEITSSQFYLGLDDKSNPSNDERSDLFGHDNGLNDDKNPTSVTNFDDETSLDAYLDGDGSGNITFKPTGNTIDLEIPYVNLDGRNGQIVVWIDFDDNGSFDSDEATVANISGAQNPGTVNMTVNIPADAKNCSTYMRVLMTDNLDNLTGKGNAAVYAGYGETEDYPIKLKSDSLIKKSVADENGDSSVSLGETLTYTITIDNTSSSIPVTNVNVKDSLLEDLPSWLEFNDDVTINPDHATTGSLVDGDFTIHEIPAGGSVDITFSVTLSSLPEGITEIENIVTDNGDDPLDPGFVCDESSKKVDCDQVIVPIIGATTIEKAITSETGTENGVAEYGEDISYEIKVSNPTSSSAHDVEVRDSLLEDLPAWMSVVDGPNVEPSGLSTSGALSTGDFKIDTIGAGETVTITYTVHISDIPTDVTDITNIATDNGDDPTTVDPETCTPDGPSEDCAIASIPPETIISKKVVDATGDEKLSIGEKATYTITVTNPANEDAINVAVRDSVYEAISNGSMNFVSIISGPTLSPALESTGDMGDGTFQITNLPANSSVDITFVISYDKAPTSDSGIVSLVNIATDNGQDPSEITDPETTCPKSDDDCATAEIPLLGETIIDKAITSERMSTDGIAEIGEEITYSISITNPSSAEAINVPVRDSVLEKVNTTSWLSVKDGSFTITPDTVATSGNLTTSDFVIESIAAGETVTIEYTLVVGEYPNNITNIENWATDNGQDPTTCTEENKDCAEANIDTNAPTEIKKELVDESLTANGIFEDEEDLTYAITVTNTSDRDAINVLVRDNLLENLPSYFTWDGSFTIDPTDTAYDGDLASGNFTINKIPAGESVTITYTLDGGTLPEGVTLVGNIVTNNGKDPVFPCLPSSKTCDIVINPTEPETIIKKSVKDENGTNIAEVGETLTFTIEVQNPTRVTAPNTIVRDSVLENLPSYLTFNNDVVVTNESGDTLVKPDDYTGVLTDGNGIEILEIPGKSSVFITYSVTVNEIPNNVGDVKNIVTDDGQDPTACTEISTDCAGTITPVDPETVIEKTTNLADGEAVAIGDQIEYTITVSNPNTEVPALNVNVQDSLVQNMPSYLTLVSGAIDPTDTAYSGLLSSGNVTIASIEPGASVSITYVVEVTDIPNDVESIINIATDNGQDPDTLTPELCTLDAEDCATTTTPVDPETLISKSASDKDGNKFNNTNPVQAGEDVYYTISVSNPGSNSALDVNVIDTLVDQITPSLVARILGTNTNFTYNDDMVLTMNDLELTNPDDFTGDLADANLVINAIPAGDTVEITFSIHVDSLDGITEITNVVTDNGSEVESCDDLSTGDCDSVTIPVNPETEIEKSVTESIVDGYATVGEEITYSIEVTNSSDLTALNVVVKDSLLANLPGYLESVGTITIDPTDTVVSGDLATAEGMTISEIPAGETVTISYTLKLISNPDDGEVSLINLATDDGTDPDTLTPEICDTDKEDCDSTELPVDADTEIRKDLIAQTGNDDGAIENGELLTYQISVNNPGSSAAINVQVIDNLLSNLPSWLTLEGNVVVDPSDMVVTGNLTTSDGIVIAEIPAGETVTITYNLRVSMIPNNVDSLVNLATDNGQDPDTVDPELCVPSSALSDGKYAEDCGSTINPIHPETIITKTVDTGDDEFISVGEEIFYTIEVSNPSVVDAIDVTVIDNLYSNLPTYLQITTPFEVTDDVLMSDPTYTGDLVDSTGITIDTIKSGKTVTITYGLTLTSVPVTGDGMITNIVTDNGQDPETCTEVNSDCSGTITPIDADTIISKKLVLEDGDIDGLAESGETLTFKLTVRNITSAPAENVIVRDSMAELASSLDWITFNGIVATNPEVLSTTGSLEDGTYTIDEVLAHSTVSIFYSITIDSIPEDIATIGNIVTDNGQDPTDPDYVCEDNPNDCDEVVTPVNPDTIINKTATTESGDLVVTEGETIDYIITVNNPSTVVANNVQVIDSLLSALPTYVTLGTITIQNGAGEDLVLDVDYTGDLQTADGIVINEIGAGDTITISYSITLDEIPEDGVVNIRNVVTDNGNDPSTITPEVDCDKDNDCGQVIVPIDPETTIKKDIINESIENDFIAQNGEELTYKLTVSNPTDALALDVEVKDSLLEMIEATEWLSLVGDIVIEATPTYTMVTSGDLQSGDFVISEIPAKTTITITYTVLVGEIPNGTTEIPNVATDNGDDPDTIDPEICNPTVNNDDCGAVVIPTNPDTTIEKNLIDESIEVNTIAEVGETLTYELNVTNPDTENPALDVEVRDSIIEAIISGDINYLGFDGTFTVSPDTVTYTSTPSGMITIDEIPAGETVTIQYQITVISIPDDVLELDNIATDNGKDPIDPDTCTDEGDCSEVVVPTNPDTIIEKSVVDGNEDGYAQTGEDLTFTIRVYNNSDLPTASIPVKDSLVQGITNGTITGLTFNYDTTITGVTYDASASGKLEDGTYVINSIPAGQYAEITYTVTVDEIGNDVASIINIATDNGIDPETLTPEECALDATNCDSTETPVDPETTITKEVKDTDDGIVQTGEELTYTITVTNPSTVVAAKDVVVRDSILENLPSYITFVSEVVTPDTLTTSGSLTTSGIKIAELPAGSSATITVKVIVDKIPNDVENILNIVTDNGVDPTDPSIVDPENPEICIDPKDCDIAVIPVEPETVIKKEISNETGTEAGIIENNETIEYTISVSNLGSNSAYDVAVRDSLVENLPSYASYDDNLVLIIGGTKLVLDTDYTGDLSTKDLIIGEIKAGETVEITYSITFGTIPNDVSSIGNLAVDTNIDPTDPDVVDPELCDQTGEFADDCSEVVVPVHPETIITKTADAGEDNLVQEGEEIQYTVTVENPSVVDAKDVQVIDSLLADLPTYMELTTPIVISDGTNELVLDTDYTGNLMSASGIVINTIAAGSTITITYGLTLNDVPASGVIDIANVVTDNGEGITDPELCDDDSEDCDEVVIPVDPDTTITKEITNESLENDNQAQQGEELTYTIVVTNPTDADAINVEVKDSLLANLPAYLTLVGDVTIDPTTLDTTGDLTTDDFVIANLPANSSVTITYTLLVGDVPSDLTEIENIATDNGQDPTTVDPETCSPDGTSEDCGAVVIPTNPETVIEKAKTDESIDVNGIAEPGETITYEIRVTNNDDALNALDIPVRDSLIEAIKNGDYPDYTYNGITSTTPSPLASNGDLELGTFTIDSIAPGETVVIEYTVTLADPVTQTDKFIGNMVTDNGQDPIGICPPTSEDCAQVIVPKEPDTTITKSVSDENADGTAQQGEILTYTVTLENTTLIPAENVHVRDSLLEDMPAYLELVDGSFTVDPTDTGISGNMKTGFIVDRVDAGEVITFTYQVKVLDVPDDVEEVINIVTDDAQNPTECTEISSDCSGTITPLEPETVIEKSVTDASGDGAVQTGEELTYEIKVTNKHDTLAALDVEVRDSIIENLPKYMTLVSESYEPSDLSATGTLATGGIIFDEIPANTTVTITVVATVDEIPTDVVEILNIATDNGVDPDTVDPETCYEIDPSAEDCGTAVIPVDPETTIEKSVTDSNGDGTAEDNDTLTYTIDVTNPGSNTALDVEVKDSLVEEITAGKYDWLTYGDDLVITISGTELVLNSDYNGDLSSSDLVINEIAAGSTATITFTIKVGIIPDGVDSIANVVTDNGDEVIDPDTELPITCPVNSEDCDDAIVDTNPETVISKEVTVSGEDQIASIGDDLTFTIVVENPEDIDALNIPVKDSLLPTLPNEFAELKGNIVITNGSDTLELDTDYTGDLQTAEGIVINNIPAGTTVEITYTITMIDVPEDLETVINVATDDGTYVIDPDTGLPIEVCPEGEADDCATTVTPVDPETVIEKEITNQTGSDDSYFEENETVTYQITVTNPGANTAVLVEVRDSLIEAIAAGTYDYLSVSNIVIADSVGTPLISGDEFTGSLETSDLVINAIEAGDYITITYDVTSTEFPNDSVQVGNLVTDDGSEPTDITDPSIDPEEICPEGDEDCATVVKPIEPETTIEKSLDSESIEEDGIAEIGEEITFKLAVTNNNTEVSAHDVAVRDSLVEQIVDKAAASDYIENVGFTVQPEGTGYDGSLEGKDLVITEIEAGQTVNVYVTFKVIDVPEGVFTFENIASDNGLDPNKPETCTDEDDCSSVVTPLNPETVIEKSVIVDGEDQIASIGDTLTFTINVANPSSYDSVNVEVKDSLVEGIKNGDYPYLDFNEEVSVVGNTFDVVTSGDLSLGSYVIEEIPAGMNVDITYTVTVLDIPTDVAEVINVATDNGTDVIDPDGKPITECPEGETDDCATTVTPVDPETVIEKEITNQTGSDDNYFEENETVTYQITVTNPGANTAVLVEVRDSLIEAIAAGTYDYLSVSNIVIADSVGTPLISGVDFTGNLETSDLVINAIEAGDYITITYDVTSTEFPNDSVQVGNLVTDDGSEPTDITDPSIDPEEICPEGDDDCATVVKPIEPETTIEKSLDSESIEEDGIAEIGEEITFKLAVTNNNTEVSAHDVAVRDSLVEQIVDKAAASDYIENVGFTVQPEGTEYDGSLEGKDLVLTEIEAGQTVNVYVTFKVIDVPEGVFTFENIASDNGLDPNKPETCTNEDDCSSVVTPLNPETVIEKSVVVDGEDQIASIGDTLTFTINVANPSSYDSVNVEVKDSLVEGIKNGDYPYLQFNEDVTAVGNTFDVVTSGDLTLGSYVIEEIPAGMNVDITYTVTVLNIPTDVAEVINVATDNGTDVIDPDTGLPIEVCPEGETDDCATTVTPVDPETVIEKEASISGDDNFASTGEDITYTISVTNPNEEAAAVDVIVRDSMLETLATDYPYLSFVSEVVTPGTLVTSGSLLDSGITIAELEAGQTATITVVLHVDSVPDDVTEILNVVTDNGQDPTDPDLCDEDSSDCDSVTEPVDADTKIEKAVITESLENDDLAEQDEVLTYMIKVTNENSSASAFDVPVKDSMYQDMPSELELVSKFVVNPSNVDYTGDLADGTLMLEELAPGQTVTITYQVKVNVINESTEFVNIATDNGQNPIDPDYICDESTEDCAEVVLPIKPDTTIEKSIIDETIYVDNLIEDGETITYRLTIENISSVDSLDTPVRDNVLEALDTPEYSWLTLGSVIVNPGDTNYSGSLADGTFVVDVPALSTVTIDYELTASEVPSDQKGIQNIATDNGTDPETCSPVLASISKDCSIHFSLLEADTSIIKEAYDENNNGVIEDGETVRYSLTVTNYTNIAAIDTPVRDSLLENLPDYATAELVAINDTHGTDYVEGVNYTGSLETGDMVINRIARRDSVSIIYDITFDIIPDDVAEIANVATVDGNEPTDCAQDDPKCSEVIIPVEGDTTINKAITDEDGEVDGIIEEGETVTYQLTVQNDSDNKAVFVEVRDSMLENMPDYVSLVGDIEIAPELPATGDLLSGDYIITAMEPGEVVTITYQVQFTNIPDDVLDALNIATDNGEDPTETVCPLPMRSAKSIISDDCAYVKVPVSADTEIEKQLIDESIENNKLAELNEELTYQLTISNNKDKDAYNVEVRDSLLENTPSWLSVESIAIDTPNSYSGDIQEGTLMLDKVDANSEVTITYILKVNELPTDVETIENIATDNGQDPNVIDPEICIESPKDCSSVTEPIEGDTTIEKNVMSTSDTYYPGDVIDYQLIVSNDTINTAYDVPVRDSLLENTPDYIKYNGDITVKGANASGNITKGTFSLDEVPANSKVYISYSLTLVSNPEEATLLNVATDDGIDPSTIDPDTIDPDNKGKDDKDDAIVEIGTKEDNPKSEDSDYEDMTLGQTGAKGMLILIDMVLILGVATILKKRMA